MYYSGIARATHERQQAIELASRSFDISPHHVRVSHRERLLTEHPGFSSDSVVVVSISPGIVVASAFLLDCTIRTIKGDVDSSFISSVSVAEPFRGRGLGRILIEKAVDLTVLRAKTLAIIIARREVDNFYTKFGFWGVSHYNIVELDCRSIASGRLSSLQVKLQKCTTDYLPLCHDLYLLTYAQLSGSCTRGFQMWSYAICALSRIGIRFEIITIYDSPVGYIIHDGLGNIYEISAFACYLESEACQLLRACFPGCTTLKFHIDPAHPIFRSLLTTDIRISARECRHGGHMVRILDESFASVSPKMLSKDLHGYPLLSYSQTIDSLGLSTFSTSSAFTVNAGSSFNIPLIDQI